MTTTNAYAYPLLPPPYVPPTFAERCRMTGRALATDLRAVARNWRTDPRESPGAIVDTVADAAAALASAAFDVACDTADHVLDAVLDTPWTFLPDSGNPDLARHAALCLTIPCDEIRTVCVWDERSTRIRDAWREVPLRVRVHQSLIAGGVAEAVAEVRGGVAEAVAEVRDAVRPVYPIDIGFTCNGCGACQCLGCKRRRALSPARPASGDSAIGGA